VEEELASSMSCKRERVPQRVDVLMSTLYPPDTQRMNPVGIAFACTVVYLIRRFSSASYVCQMEARIGVDIFPALTNFRRRTIDIVCWRQGTPVAVISTKWGVRHDRVRDPQEEADIYKAQVPNLKFFVVTNEFDSARLQKLLTYPSIDRVFHVRRDLVWQAYNGAPPELQGLQDLTELFPLLQ
jgi:hypothetical protein